MTEQSSPLVAAHTLRDWLASDAPVVLLDCRVGPDVQLRFQTSHLQGAQHAHLETHLSGDTSHPTSGGRHPLPDPDTWAAQLGAWGITPGTMVVTYDDRAGAMAAARAWWMLRAIGHQRVAILDGGLRAATEAGIPLATGAARPPTPTLYPVRPWTGRRVGLADVQHQLTEPSHLVIDVRAAARYQGLTEPIDPVAGHMPGAHSAPLTDHTRDGKLLPLPELRAHFTDLLGLVAPEHVTVHCGSGVTACHTLWAMEVAGLQGAALYVGSWSEWCRQGLPIATGELP